MFGKLSYYSMSALLNNQIQPVSETRFSGFAMSSMLSHWLTTKPFVLLLYKCDTTRMVGRPVNSTAIYTSLLMVLIPLKTIPFGYFINYSSSTTSLHLSGYLINYSSSTTSLNIPQYPLTACI